MLKYLAATLGILLLAAAPVSAGRNLDDLWIHVAVDGSDDDPERVRVNVPQRGRAALTIADDEVEDRELTACVLRALRSASFVVCWSPSIIENEISS